MPPAGRMERRERMDDSRDVLLKGQGLVKEFKMGKSTVHAVADVDIEIRTGETLSLVGENENA